MGCIRRATIHRIIFGPKADAGHWMSRISYLFDVFNGIVLDAQMESYTTSQAALCKQHLPFIKKGDVVLFDRYYASYELMFQLLAKGSHFVFRMKDNWWKSVDNFIKSRLDEQIVCFQLPAKLKYLLAKYPHLSSTIQVRLIKKTNRKGKVQVFCTSLTDRKSYSRTSIINLYKQRWGIEEAYKLIKSRLELAEFSGLTAWAVQQDFYAKTTVLSLCNVMCGGIEPKPDIRKKLNKKSSQPRTPIINRTYALSKLKNMMKDTAFSLEKFEKHLLTFIQRISKEIAYSRRNQSSPRNIKLARKYPMAYLSI